MSRVRAVLTGSKTQGAVNIINCLDVVMIQLRSTSTPIRCWLLLLYLALLMSKYFNEALFVINQVRELYFMLMIIVVLLETHSFLLALIILSLNFYRQAMLCSEELISNIIFLVLQRIIPLSLSYHSCSNAIKGTFMV